MKKLTDGAKLLARFDAAAIEARALFPIGSEHGYATATLRGERLEIAALLRRFGQPHAGKPDNGRAYHCIDVMNMTGMTARQAVRWVLACDQWLAEWHDAVDLAAEARVGELLVEYETGLKERAAEVPTKDAKRLHAKVSKALAASRQGGLNQWVAFKL